MREFDAALAASPTPQAALQQAGLLATAGCYEQALQHLDNPVLETSETTQGLHMQRLHGWILERQQFWQHEHTTLRATIAEDLRKEGTEACTR